MKTVLLVEDDYSVREYLKKAIAWKENGYCVIGEADNGVEALEVIREKLHDKGSGQALDQPAGRP